MAVPGRAPQMTHRACVLYSLGRSPTATAAYTGAAPMAATHSGHTHSGTRVPSTAMSHPQHGARPQATCVDRRRELCGREAVFKRSDAALHAAAPPRARAGLGEPQAGRRLRPARTTCSNEGAGLGAAHGLPRARIPAASTGLIHRIELHQRLRRLQPARRGASRRLPDLPPLRQCRGAARRGPGRHDHIERQPPRLCGPRHDPGSDGHLRRVPEGVAGGVMVFWTASLWLAHGSGRARGSRSRRA